MSKQLENTAALLRDDATTVQCIYPNSREEAHRVPKIYTFRCLWDLAKKLSPGDLVIAKGNNGYQIVEVHSIDEEAEIDVDAHFTYKWVFQRVDTPHVLNLEEEDAQLIKGLRRQQRQTRRNQALTALGVQDYVPLCFDESARPDGDVGDGVAGD